VLKKAFARYCSFLPLLQKHFNHFGVEVFSTLFTDITQGRLPRPALAVGTIGGNRVPRVGDGEEPCFKRDLFPRKSPRIAGTIPFLVMAVWNI